MYACICISTQDVFETMYIDIDLSKSSLLRKLFVTGLRDFNLRHQVNKCTPLRTCLRMYLFMYLCVHKPARGAVLSPFSLLLCWPSASKYYLFEFKCMNMYICVCMYVCMYDHL